jgi:predicted nucleotidyltransferase
MATELSLRSILLERLNRILNPTFELKFTWTLLIAGFGLIGYQRLVQLAGSIEIIQPDARIKLELSSETDAVLSLLGIVLVLLSCLFFYKLKLLPPLGKKTYKNLAAAASDIRKIMEENRRIFLSFGPNSSAGATGEIRHDPSSWQQFRVETICPNNEQIRNILKAVKHVSAIDKPVVEKMLSHIEAFAHHCKNPGSDYRNNQFPQEFSSVIWGYCAKANRGAIKVPTYSQWLNITAKQLSLRIDEAYIFGSALFGEETSDVDLLVKSPASTISEVKDQAALWEKLSTEFSAKFSLRLHMVVFSNLETDAYVGFVSKVGHRERVI